MFFAILLFSDLYTVFYILYLIFLNIGRLNIMISTRLTTIRLSTRLSIISIMLSIMISTRLSTRLSSNRIRLTPSFNDDNDDNDDDAEDNDDEDDCTDYYSCNYNE